MLSMHTSLQYESNGRLFRASVESTHTSVSQRRCGPRENGRRAVEEKYNGEQEARKLLALYEGLLGS